MNYVQLKAFHSVATQGSYTKAAEVLHVTQPTLSDHVKALEQRYEIKLFERQGRGVVLTGIGRALLQITRRQFSLESEAERLLSTAQGLSQGELRVMADGPYLMVPMMAEFHRLYPNITLKLGFGNSREVLKSILELRADVGVLPDLRTDERIYAVPGIHNQLVCFVNLDHPLAKKRSITLQELAGFRLIIRESGSNTRRQFERALKNASVSIHDTLEFGSREAVREAVAAGLGAGVVAESEFGHDQRLYKLRIRNKIPKSTEYFACLAENRALPVVSAFFDLIDECKSL